MSGFQGSYITCTSAPLLLFSVFPYADLRSLIVHNFWRNAFRDFESFAYMHEIVLGFPRSLLGVLLSCSSKKKKMHLSQISSLFSFYQHFFPAAVWSIVTRFPASGYFKCHYYLIRDLFFCGCEGFYHRTESDLFPSLLCISS